VKQFTINGVEYLGVKVSGDYTPIVVDNIIKHFGKPNCVGAVKDKDGSFKKHWIDLPQGSWTIIGLLSQIQNDEEKLSQLVEQHPTAKGCYRDYTKSDFSSEWLWTFKTAIESFHSLQQSLKMWTVNPYGKAPKCGCMGPSDLGACPACDEFMDAEDLVSEYLILKRV